MMVSGVWRGERRQMAEKDGNVFDACFSLGGQTGEREEDIKRKLLFNIASHWVVKPLRKSCRLNWQTNFIIRMLLEGGECQFGGGNFIPRFKDSWLSWNIKYPEECWLLVKMKHIWKEILCIIARQCWWRHQTFSSCLRVSQEHRTNGLVTAALWLTEEVLRHEISDQRPTFLILRWWTLSLAPEKDN